MDVQVSAAYEIFSRIPPCTSVAGGLDGMDVPLVARTRRSHSGMCPRHCSSTMENTICCPECRQTRVLEGGKYVRGPAILGGTRAGEIVLWCKSCHPDDKTHKFKVMADGTAVPHSTRHSTHSTAIANAAAAPILPAAGSTRALRAAAEAAAIICGLDAA